MTIKITRWSPDTCSCVIEYSWDDTLPADQRVHTLSTYVNKCPAHSSLSDTNGWNAVFEENPRKNNAIQAILDNSPTTALYDVIGTTRKLKDSIGYNLSWSGTAPNRVLTLSFTGITLTTQQKNTLQTALNTKFGSGKVTVV